MDQSVKALDFTHASQAITEGWRRDIQALRGIAVAVVALEHFGLPVHSGYLGVDLFIVISGYVVSGVLMRMYMSDGKVNLWKFFKARVKRLAPAHIMCVSIVLILAGLVGNPSNRSLLTDTARASLLSIANVQLFLAKSDYFAAVSNDQVFRHLWSLSLEEQFYVGFALLLATLLKLAEIHRFKRFSTVVLVVLILMSLFGFNLVAIKIGQMQFESLSTERVNQLLFYSPLARAPQFLLGALALVLRPLHKLIPAKSFFQLKTLALPTLLAILIFAPSSEDFYSWQRFCVTILSMLLLFVGTPVLNSMEWLGNRSYSIYLWHWPIAVLLEVPQLTHWIHYKTLGATLLTLAVSCVSYLHLEQFHSERSSKRRTNSIAHPKFGATILTCVWIWCLTQPGTTYSVTAHLFSVKTPPLDDIQVEFDRWYTDRGCLHRGPLWYECGSIDSRGIVLIGDSHAWSLAPGIADEGSRLGKSVAIRVRAGCPIAPSPDDICRQWASALAEEIRSSPGVRVLVVACARISDGCPDGLSSTSDLDYVTQTSNWIKSRWGNAVDEIEILRDIPYVEPKSVLDQIISTKQETTSRNLEINKLQDKRRLALLDALRRPDSVDQNLFSNLCDGISCLYLDEKNNLLWRDLDHLTLSGSHLAGREAGQLLSRVISEISQTRTLDHP